MTVGVVGLGHMGRELAANLAGAGHELVTHDLAGPDGSPPGATFVDSVDDVARAADVVVLSLPDGRASAAVASQLVAAADRKVTHVVDTSTTGVEAARTTADLLAAHGVGFVDAAVSGGPAGARARTLSVMYAGPDEACAAGEPVLTALSDVRHRVGDRPGMAQALKLANNFLSATALAATSEALAFTTAVGLDPAVVLNVLNASSGRSSATEDKFPAHVLTGTYASGFANTLMAKDIRLYLEAATDAGVPSTVAGLTAELWRRFADAEPGADFTRIALFVEGAG